LSPILLRLKMIAKEVVYSLVEEKLSDGMFVVEINVAAGNAISVVIDSDLGLSIDKCIEISRYVEHQFDREVEDFSLEVSSPGLTSPFKVLRQYHKYLNKEVEVLTAKGDKISGVLKSADESSFFVETSVALKVDGKKHTEIKTVEFFPKEIKSVKPVITFK
jgi:ribosome maturation factor RimP